MAVCQPEVEAMMKPKKMLLWWTVGEPSKHSMVKKKNPTNGCFLLRIVCLHSSQCWYLDLFVYHTFCSALWGSYISKIVRFTNPSCQALHLWPNTQSHTSQSPVRNYWKLEMTATYTVLERLALLPSHQLYQSWRVYFIERRAERATHVHSCQDWLQLESDLPTGSAGSSAPLLIWLGEVSLWYRMTVLHFNYQVVFENARCFFFQFLLASLQMLLWNRPKPSGASGSTLLTLKLSYSCVLLSVSCLRYCAVWYAGRVQQQLNALKNNIIKRFIIA